MIFLLIFLPLNILTFLLVGNYGEALECAIELQEKVKIVMGTECAIYASCLNNVALMHKLVSSGKE